MMSATVALSKQGSFSLRQRSLNHVTLGVPIMLYASSILLVAVAAHFDMPIIAFDVQELQTTV